jgi:Ca2+-dependent lipid-binding protein
MMASLTSSRPHLRTMRTQAYAVIKLDNVSHKTDVCRKTLHPVWNHVCTFEV